MPNMDKIAYILTMINSVIALWFLSDRFKSRKNNDMAQKPQDNKNYSEEEFSKKLLEFFGDFANFCVFREVKYEIADMTENQISQIKGARDNFAALVTLRDKSNIVIKSPNELLFVRHKYTNYYFMYDSAYDYIKDVELKIRSEICER